MLFKNLALIAIAVALTGCKDSTTTTAEPTTTTSTTTVD